MTIFNPFLTILKAFANLFLSASGLETGLPTLPWSSHQRKRRVGNLKAPFPHDMQQLPNNLHGWLWNQRIYWRLRGHNV